jgi:predicted RNA-binding protein with TRAM domain
MFEATVVTQAGKTYPALKVVKNVASADQLNDMEVYCKFTYGGLTVTCHTTMGVRVATGTVYDVLIQSVGEDGSGDTVIDTETESLTLTATLVRNGESVAGNGGQWTWKRRTEAGLVTVGTEAGKTLVGGTNGNQLTLWEGAVDGVEEYFAEVTVGDVTYRRGIQVTDVQDPYYIDMGREGNTVLRKTESVSYTPRVLSRGKNTVQAGWAFAFGLTNGAGEAVSAGTVTTKDGSSTLSLDGATVKQHGGLTVCVTATKES